MTIEVYIKTVVLPGGKIEVSDPALVSVVGQEATIVVTVEEQKPVEQRSVIDILQSFQGHQVFKSAEEVDAYFREERDAWDR
ncbi:MAG TPA: hypothetical protein DHW02_02285 [Ktedonobacter sp.]|nr:hypothetical protein [Ktedonobacter sp.]